MKCFKGQKITRLSSNPIISLEMNPSYLGGNVCGPSMIDVPSWISAPLGKYYLYFAHHSGQFIRMAYADDLEGPWVLYLPGTLSLDQSACRHHIASPEVIVNNEKQEIEMYYHGFPDFSCGIPPEPLWINKVLNPEIWGRQRTFRASSKDGLNFTSDKEILGPNYVRLFEWRGETYYIAMPGVLCKYNKFTSKYEYGARLFDSSFRHCDVVVYGDDLYVFYTNAGDNPEHIICSRVALSSKWDEWKVIDTFSLFYPEQIYEGALEPLLPSKRGAATGFQKQLRDPNIFTEGENMYVIYCGGGESNIAIALVGENE